MGIDLISTEYGRTCFCNTSNSDLKLISCKERFRISMQIYLRASKEEVVLKIIGEGLLYIKKSKEIQAKFGRV